MALGTLGGAGAQPPRRSARIGGRIDLGVVELVAAHRGALRPDRMPGVGHSLAVAEREPLPHPRAHGDHPAHRVAVEVGGQVEQAAALGQHRPAAARKGPDLRAQRAVVRQLGAEHLGEAAGHHDRPSARRQLLVDQRVERHQLGAGRLDQLQVLLVVKREGGSARHGHPDRLGGGEWEVVRRGGRPGLAGQLGGGLGQRQQARQVTVLGDRPRQSVDRIRGALLALGHRHQAQVTLGRLDVGVARKGPEHRHAERLERLAQQGGVPRAADSVEHYRRHVHGGVEGGVAMDDGGHRARHRSGVDHEYDRGAQQLGNVGGAGQLAPSGGAVVKAHHPLDHGHLSVLRAVAEQRCDQLRPGQEGVEVAPGPAAGERVVAGVDEVGADLEAGGPHAATAQCGQYAGGHRGLAGAGAGAGDHQARDHATTPGGSSSVRRSGPDAATPGPATTSGTGSQPWRPVSGQVE